MPYRSCLGSSFQHADFFSHGDEHMISVRGGYDLSRQSQFFAVAGLSPAGGDLEYFFHIVEAFSDGSPERTYWSGADTKHLIPEDERNKILEITCEISQALINHVQPKAFFRCVDDNLPPRALEKHHAITRVFESCGYTCAFADPFLGKRIVWMTLSV